jgi:hypothetical protein
MKNINLKTFLPHIYAVLIIITVLFIYFSPVLQGKEIKQDDIIRHKAMSKELVDYREKYNEEALWTNSMFGGMPAFQISVLYKSNLIQYIHKFILKTFPKGMGIIFLLIIGFYLFLVSLKMNNWISLIFSLAFGFSTYFLISLAAGHNSKLTATAYMAVVMVGIVFAYRKNKWLGASLTALALSLQIGVNHPQITYYFLFVILAYAILEFISAYKNKLLKQFFVTSGILIVAGLISIGPNISRLWSTYEYSKETIRGGKSELTSNDKKQGSGLDLDYAMSWSYGIPETFTLLIPDFYGSASAAALDKNSETYKTLVQKGVPPKQAENYIKHLPLYWGDQPFTSGPVYVGAILVFLFVLGLFIVKNNLKWWLLSVTVIGIVFSWGKNFLLINELMFDYFPLFNKFRSPSMWLTLACFAIPVMAALTLQTIFNEKEKINQKAVLNAFYIVGGVTLFFALFGGSLFDFTAASDNNLAQQGWPVDALMADRASMMKTSAFKSFILISIAFALIWFFIKSKLSNNVLITVLALLIIGDLWMEDKKYLNEEHFINKRDYKNLFAPDAADQMILADKSLDYRVLNLTVNPFTDAMTSYFHKSVGGYHGAKLIRYQDLIERQLSKNNMQVLNMLNTKYFIVPNKQSGGRMAQMNPQALGNAWFVNTIKWVDNADEEMASLDNFNPKNEVIIDKRYKEKVNENISLNGSSIKLTDYKPNHLTYKANVTDDNAFAVFSEIYYEGGDKDWKTYIDGKEYEHIRVNYVLRGMNIPKGEHVIEFKFWPRSYFEGEKYSLLFSIIIILVVVAGIWKYKKEDYQL